MAGRHPGAPSPCPLATRGNRHPRPRSRSMHRKYPGWQVPSLTRRIWQTTGAAAGHVCRYRGKNPRGCIWQGSSEAAEYKMRMHSGASSSTSAEASWRLSGVCSMVLGMHPHPRTRWRGLTGFERRPFLSLSSCSNPPQRPWRHAPSFMAAALHTASPSPRQRIPETSPQSSAGLRPADAVRSSSAGPPAGFDPPRRLLFGMPSP